MNDLVIQGHGLTPDDARALQRDTGAKSVHTPRPGMARLTDLAERGPVAPFCTARRFDYTFLDRPLRLDQFRLVAMDMDSTLITIECIDEIADMVGVKPQVAAITAAAMRGELDFPAALRRRVSLLAGLDEGALERVYEERLRLSPGAENLLAAARTAGLKTLLVSGGFTFFTERLKHRLQLDHTLANTLEVKDGKLTGQVLGAIVDADAKAAKVREVCTGLGCDPGQAIVLGDGANDLKMMALSGLSVAFRAKPVVQQQAHVALNHVGLDGVLNLFD
jgi:phosphoserine phosphatase